MNEHKRQAIEAILAELRQRSEESHKVRIALVQLAAEENKRMEKLADALLEIARGAA